MKNVEVTQHTSAGWVWPVGCWPTISDRQLFSDLIFAISVASQVTSKAPLHVVRGNLAKTLNMSFSGHSWRLGTSHLAGEPTDSPGSLCLLGDMYSVRGKSPA